MTAEIPPFETDPILAISETALADVAKTIKMKDDSWLEAMSRIDESHPLLHMLVHGHSRQLTDTDEISIIDPPAALYFRKGAYTAYLLLQKVSEYTVTPLHTEVSGNDFVESIENNYRPPEADIELKTTLFNRVDAGLTDSTDLYDDIDLQTSLGLGIFAQQYPQYYAMCLKFGARFSTRPPHFIEEQLTRSAKDIHRIIGQEALLQTLPGMKDDYDTYTSSMFMYGFAGLATLLLGAQQNDALRRQYGFDQ